VAVICCAHPSVDCITWPPYLGGLGILHQGVFILQLQLAQESGI
jgi:hypothetical protein